MGHPAFVAGVGKDYGALMGLAPWIGRSHADSSARRISIVYGRLKSCPDTKHEFF
jgi:hypothetical protein